LRYFSRRQELFCHQTTGDVVACVTLIACLAGAGFPTKASENAVLSGNADIVDADTIRVNGNPIRLYGIDAPESRQTCERAGRSYACGKTATRALADLIAARPLRCTLLGKDNYGRSLGICSVGGTELNSAMVSQGWALAFVKYSSRYVEDQKRGEVAKLGLWAGSFVKPWEWRSGESRSAQATGSCIIKGNINGKGERIYHMPFQRYYSRTHVDIRRGERWFCTEDEALSAGWRRSLR
jgi:endonuclease YncB( thermonuclease family)